MYNQINVFSCTAAANIWFYIYTKKSFAILTNQTPFKPISEADTPSKVGIDNEFKPDRNEAKDFIVTTITTNLHFLILLVFNYEYILFSQPFMYK